MESVNLFFYHSSLSVVFQFLLMFIAVFITFSLFNKTKKPMLSPRDLIIIIPGQKNWVSRASVIKTLKW